MLRELVLRGRSYRKFDEGRAISEETLLGLIDTARFCPASVNLQPLKYLYCCDRPHNDLIFPLTAWARLLPGFQGPGEGDRPAAYILVCVDRNIAPNADRFAMDVGIASQTIMLAAVEQGLGGCMIGNFSREKVARALELPEQLEVSLILALGKPGEEIVLEELPAGARTNYYRDERDVHHVPKRPLEEVARRL